MDSAAGATAAAATPCRAAGGDEQAEVRGETSRGRGEHEPDQPPDKQPSSPEHIGRSPAEHEQTAKRDRVRGDHPLHRCGRGVQLGAD